MFYFGDIPRESRLGNARFAPPEEEMLLFFSRRIGLTDAGQEIPIAAGGRLTGRIGSTRYNIYTDQSNTKVTHTNHVAMAWFFEKGGYHRPLSDLFVVYNEQRLTDQPTPINTGRGLIVKYTHTHARILRIGELVNW